MKQLLLLFVMALLMKCRPSFGELIQSREECERESHNSELIGEVCRIMEKYMTEKGFSDPLRNSVALASQGFLNIYKDYSLGEGMPDLFSVIYYSPHVNVFESRMSLFKPDEFIHALTQVTEYNSKEALQEQLKHAGYPLNSMKAKYWSVVFHVELQRGFYQLLPYDESFRSNHPLSDTINKVLKHHFPIFSSAQVLTWDALCPGSSTLARVYFSCPYTENRSLKEILFPCLFRAEKCKSPQSSMDLNSGLGVALP